MGQLQEFCQNLRGQDFLILDTETTGLQEGEIVSIAIINNKGETLLDALIKPKEPIPLDATKIHGITDDRVIDCMTWVDIYPIVFRLLEKQNVVVYNAVYDRRMMHQSSERWDLPATIWKEHASFFCCMEAYAEFHNQWNRYRGSFTWKPLSFAFQAVRRGLHYAAHSALGDCLATLAVTEFLLDGFHDFDADSYGNKDISEDLGL